jgi:hypothetical protein
MCLPQCADNVSQVSEEAQKNNFKKSVIFHFKTDDGPHISVYHKGKVHLRTGHETLLFL